MADKNKKDSMWKKYFKMKNLKKKEIEEKGKEVDWASSDKMKKISDSFKKGN